MITDDISHDLLRVIIAVFIPPLAVLTQVGLSKHFWFNIILTLCGFVPGLIHAIFVIIHYDVGAS